MKVYEQGSKLDKILNRISIVSYIIVIILGLLGFLFIYMDMTFLFTAILAGLGFNKYARESEKQTYIIFGIAIVANILRTVFTFPEYHPPGGSFLPNYTMENHIGSSIILTYIGIILVILHYRNKERFTLFNLSCAFGQLIFLKIFTLFLLVYLSRNVQESFEIINAIYIIVLIITIICGIGIIILSIANRKEHQLISIGIILGIFVLGLTISLIILILPNFTDITRLTVGYDLYGLLEFSLFSSFISILWILIMITLLIYVVIKNKNDIFKIAKKNGQIIEKQEDSKTHELENKNEVENDLI